MDDFIDVIFTVWLLVVVGNIPSNETGKEKKKKIHFMGLFFVFLCGGLGSGFKLLIGASFIRVGLNPRCGFLGHCISFAHFFTSSWSAGFGIEDIG
ncbi:MAG: hypothetical protein FJ088_15335, partial [Deltaproteobacteria bacterium]|nr:hypothetical protein [Deltaproteobacteria bacterium]